MLLLVTLGVCLTGASSLFAAGQAGRKKSAAPSPVKPAPSTNAASINSLDGVSLQTLGRFTRVVFQSSKPLKVRDTAQSGSVTLFFLEPVVCRRPLIEPAHGDLVEEIRYNYQDGKTPVDQPMPLDSVQIKLREPAGHTLQQKDWVLVVELKPTLNRPAAKKIDPVDDDPKVLTPATRKARTLPAKPLLKDFIDVGLANDVSLRLAEAEYGLAKFNHAAAVRALLPSATGRISESEGVLLKDPDDPLDDVAFRRKEYGLQWGQPIFQSGKLFFSSLQARWQKKVAKENVRKVQDGLVYEITRAYHNVIKAQNALRARRELDVRAAKVVELARRKRQLELISETEALNAESLYTQSYYRLLSDEKDLEVARLKLAALMNLPTSLPDTLPDPGVTADPNRLLELSIPASRLVELGLTHRPEVLIAEGTARYQSWGERAARADRRLKVDASGFIGRAGGAFEDQALDLRRSWSAGVQANLSFLGNSGKGSRTRERTVPDYGETTATSLDGKLLEVGLLDSLKLVSDHRQAIINRDRSVNDRDQMRRNVEVDVREAYANIQKAKIQIRGAVQERDFRTKDLAVMRMKERMNAVEPSQTLAAETAYGNAVQGYEEAVAFYHVSVAGLTKAVGMPLDAIPEFR
jgi:outer membrane protein TolC